MCLIISVFVSLTLCLCVNTYFLMCIFMSLCLWLRMFVEVRDFK